MSELEDRKITYLKKKYTKSISDLWGNMGPERVEKQKKIFQEIMTEKCPNLIKTINLKL